MYALLITGFLFGVLGVFYFSKFIFRFIREFTKINVTMRVRIIVIVLLSIFAFFNTNIFSIITNVYMHILAISLIYELLNIFLKRYKIYRISFYSGILSLVTVAAILGYGYYNMHHIVKTEYFINSNKVENLKILQITDLHLSNSLDAKDLEKYIVKMNKLDVDIVALTGDFFDGRASLQEMKKACKLLGSIKNKKGIYFVYGNHERSSYGRSREYTEDDIKIALENEGIIVLKDEVQTFDNLSIVGRIDAGWSRSGLIRKTSEELMSSIDKNNYIIVLDHQPLDLELNAKLGADLQLSGHTHGGQYFPSGPIEALLTGKLIYGKREIGNFNAITSSGIAGWGAPIKTGAPSEYVLITVSN